MTDALACLIGPVRAMLTERVVEGGMGCSLLPLETGADEGDAALFRLRLVAETGGGLLRMADVREVDFSDGG